MRTEIIECLGESHEMVEHLPQDGTVQITRLFCPCVERMQDPLRVGGNAGCCFQLEVAQRPTNHHLTWHPFHICYWTERACNSLCTLPGLDEVSIWTAFEFMRRGLTSQPAVD